MGESFWIRYREVVIAGVVDAAAHRLAEGLEGRLHAVPLPTRAARRPGCRGPWPASGCACWPRPRSGSRADGRYSPGKRAEMLLTAWMPASGWSGPPWWPGADPRSAPRPAPTPGAYPSPTCRRRACRACARRCAQGRFPPRTEGPDEGIPDGRAMPSSPVRGSAQRLATAFYVFFAPSVFTRSVVRRSRRAAARSPGTRRSSSRANARHVEISRTAARRSARPPVARPA